MRIQFVQSALARLRKQHGVSVLEAVLSAALVATGFIGTFFALDASTKSAERTSRTTVANEIAVNELDRLRRLGDSSIVSLLAQNNTSKTVTVKGINYSVQLSAYYKNGIGTEFTDACGNADNSSTAGARYIYIKVFVNFAGRYEPNQTNVTGGVAAIRPVSLDTYFATEGGDLQTSTGTLRVYVLNASDVAIASKTVQLYKMPAGTLTGTATTNSFGCVLFTGVARGDYEVRIPTTTETDIYGATNPVKLAVKIPSRAALTKTIKISSPVTVNFAWYTRLTAGNTTKTYVTPGATGINSFVGPFVAMNPALTSQSPNGYAFRTNGSNMTFYPMVDGYSLFAGSCTQNDPDDGNAGNGAERFVVPAVGSTGWSAGGSYSPNPELLVPQFKIRAGNSGNSAGASNSEIQVRMKGTTCGGYPSAGATNWIRLGSSGSGGVTNSSGYLNDNYYALPYGSYDVCVRRRQSVWWWYEYYYNPLGSGTGANVTNGWPGPTSVSYGTSTSTSCGNSSLWTL